MSVQSNVVSRASSAEADARRQAARPGAPWRQIVVGELWMLAAFVGMSLVAIALGALLGRADAVDTASPALVGLAGAVLAVAAFRGLLSMLVRAEGASPRHRGATPVPRRSTNANPAPAHARITGMTPTL